MYKLAWFVPESHLEATKAAVFEAGAGRIGAYDQCCWQVQGAGQFRPLPGSEPFIGSAEHLQKVAEYRVELVCSDAAIEAAVAALKRAHPYETPAYEVWRLAAF
jgi:hypothetical protein